MLGLITDKNLDPSFVNRDRDRRFPLDLCEKFPNYPESRPTIAGIETKVPMELPKLDRKNTNSALVILFW